MSLLLDLLPLFKKSTPTPTTGGGTGLPQHNLPKYQPHPIVRTKTRKVIRIQYEESGRIYGTSSTLALQVQGSVTPKTVTAGRSVCRSRVALDTRRANPVLTSRSRHVERTELGTVSGSVHLTTRTISWLTASTLRAERAMDKQYLKRSDEETLLALLDEL